MKDNREGLMEQMSGPHKPETGKVPLLDAFRKGARGVGAQLRAKYGAQVGVNVDAKDFAPITINQRRGAGCSEMPFISRSGVDRRRQIWKSKRSFIL